MIEIFASLLTGAIATFCFVALMFYLPPKDSEETIGYIAVWFVCVLGMGIFLQEVFG